VKHTLILTATLSLLVLALRAEDAPTKNWENEARFSFLSARGNSQSRTLGAGEKYNWAKAKNAVELWGNALNVESDNERTSEQYNAGEKLSRNFTKRNYVFERGFWESDRFAGYRHRYDISLGFGRLLVKSKLNELFTELGGGYVNEQRVSDPRNDFGSGRGYAKYIRHFSESSKFSQDGEYIHNFDRPNGYRVNSETALTAGFSNYLALKLSYTWKHVHEPPEGFKRDDSTTLVSLLINY
jgi:putative salt-induced outer membrane protein